jgi:adenylate cyclase
MIGSGGEGMVSEALGQRRKLAAILSADVAGYSRLMQDDEAATVETLTKYRGVFASLVSRHEGRIVDSPGDNVLAQFDSPVEAVQCACEIQRELARRNLQLADHRQMHFRIGINLGDILVRDDGTIYGDSVNVAARLEALAEPGGIIISDSIRMHVQSLLDLSIADAGTHKVKNIDEPVHAFRVVLDDKATATQVPRRNRKKSLAIVVGIWLLLLLVAAIMSWSKRGQEDSILAMPTGPTIAVLPFLNMSGDLAQEYFSDGITEEIITELTRFRALHVLSRNSTFQYKGQAVDVRTVGRELGARYVLEGSIRSSSGKVRVTAQLLDAEDGSHLWADTFERELTANNIFDVQDAITQQVVAVIGDSYGVISAAGRIATTKRAAESLDAYECVLSAHAFYAGSITPEKHSQVRACLERAVEIDPSYADAWAWLAAMYRAEHASKFNPRPRPLDRAERAATRSIELDKRNQQGQLVLAHVYLFRQELDAARVQAERAISLNPNSPDLLASLSHTIAVSGDWARGVALAEKAIMLTPDPPGWMHWAPVWNHYRRGEYEAALTRAYLASIPGYYQTHVNFAMIYGQLGRTEEAKAEIDELLKLMPDFPRNARSLLPWMGSGKFLDSVIDGLRKAGLDIPDEEVAAN